MSHPQVNFLLPERPRRLRYGLRMTFLVVTVIGVGLGAYVVWQNNVVAAQRRYDEQLSKLNSLLLTAAPNGFELPAKYTTFSASARIGRRPPHTGWSLTIDVPASKSNLPAATLVGDVIGFYQLGLKSLGLRVGGSGPMRNQYQVREIYLDGNGDVAMILDYDFDTSQQRIEIDALWIIGP